MDKCLVTVVCGIVLLFVANSIEGGSIKYWPEDELIADPKICNATRGANRLQDIALETNWKTNLTIFGRGGQIKYMEFQVFNSTSDPDRVQHLIGILSDRVDILQFESDTYFKLTVIRYDDNKIDINKIFQVDVQLEFGSQLRILAVLPNGVQLSVVDTKPNSFEKLYFNVVTDLAYWYYKCPSNV